MSGAELHLEIIGLAQPDAAGVLCFSDESVHELKARFREVIRGPKFAAAVDGFVRAVAAFQAAGHSTPATQLMAIGSEVVEELSGKNREAAAKLKSVVTGEPDLTTLRPVGGPPPKGSLKATAFIRPPPKQRG